jgi:VWFA-related protein
MTRLVAALLVAAGSISLLADTQPTFRSAVRTVPVYATATDASGRLVADLTQDDFEILDNGKPVAISQFSNDPQPFTVVVMLDTSASMTEHLKLLNQAAEQFLMRLLPVDQAQVGAFNDKLQLGTFSRTTDELIAALDELQFGNSTRLWDGLAFSTSAQGRGRPQGRAALHRRRRLRQQDALRRHRRRARDEESDGLRHRPLG